MNPNRRHFGSSFEAYHEEVVHKASGSQAVSPLSSLETRGRSHAGLPQASHTLECADSGSYKEAVCESLTNHDTEASACGFVDRSRTNGSNSGPVPSDTAGGIIAECVHRRTRRGTRGGRLQRCKLQRRHAPSFEVVEKATSRRGPWQRSVEKSNRLHDAVTTSSQRGASRVPNLLGNGVNQETLSETVLAVDRHELRLYDHLFVRPEAGRQGVDQLDEPMLCGQDTAMDGRENASCYNGTLSAVQSPWYVVPSAWLSGFEGLAGNKSEFVEDAKDSCAVGLADGVPHLEGQVANGCGNAFVLNGLPSSQGTSEGKTRAFAPTHQPRFESLESSASPPRRRRDEQNWKH